MPAASHAAWQLAIEPMRADDVATAARIGALSFPAGEMGQSGAGPTASEDMDARTSAEEGRLREELARPWARVLVARDMQNTHIVAFAVAWLVADEVHVLNVATDPAFRRRGAARALMRHVLDVARGGDVRHVLLEVRRSNAAAIALYRQLGFYAMGVRRGYYADGEDAVEMVLLFDMSTREIVQHADEVRLEG